MLFFLWRMYGGVWAAIFVEPNVSPLTGYWLPDAPELGDTSWEAKARAVRFPTVYGVESGIRSGAFNDWLESAGLEGGADYATLAPPESSYLSRTMADVAMPEYANRGYQDVFLRAGGDPNGVAADVLGSFDLILRVLVPVGVLRAVLQRLRRPNTRAQR